MFCQDVCLGTTHGIDKLRSLSDTLNTRVVDQVHGNQELIMLTGFASECNEHKFKKSMQDRISDVASWRWVLEDLSKRLEESINELKYEHNALRVVVQRIQEEMDGPSREGSRPGAICPLTDVVEDSISEEFMFLREQKKKFENLISDLHKQSATLEKAKKKIETDVLSKQQALAIEETCANKDYSDTVVRKCKKRKKGSTEASWAKRCASLKTLGLKALCDAVVTRQEVRGARIRLSISAQSYAGKVDNALRRRLHTNKLKLQDLSWQREEAIRDYNTLQEELSLAEKSVVDTMDQERIVAARLSDRSLRPDGEMINDEVNRKLRDEQNQLRRFSKDLRHNVGQLTALQNNLSEAISHIDCCAEDIIQVIGLDEERIRYRQGETSQCDDSSTTMTSNISGSTGITSPSRAPSPEQLTVIQEENEDDQEDYPFDF